MYLMVSRESLTRCVQLVQDVNFCSIAPRGTAATQRTATRTPVCTSISRLPQPAARPEKLPFEKVKTMNGLDTSPKLIFYRSVWSWYRLDVYMRRAAWKYRLATRTGENRSNN